MRHGSGHIILAPIRWRPTALLAAEVSSSNGRTISIRDFSRGSGIWHKVASAHSLCLWILAVAFLPNAEYRCSKSDAYQSKIYAKKLCKMPKRLWILLRCAYWLLLSSPVPTMTRQSPVCWSRIFLDTAWSNQQHNTAPMDPFCTGQME